MFLKAPVAVAGPSRRRGDGGHERPQEEDDDDVVDGQVRHLRGQLGRLPQVHDLDHEHVVAPSRGGEGRRATVRVQLKGIILQSGNYRHKHSLLRFHKPPANIALHW